MLAEDAVAVHQWPSSTSVIELSGVDKSVSVFNLPIKPWGHGITTWLLHWSCPVFATRRWRPAKYIATWPDYVHDHLLLPLHILDASGGHFFFCRVHKATFFFTPSRLFLQLMHCNSIAFSASSGALLASNSTLFGIPWPLVTFATPSKRTPAGV